MSKKLHKKSWYKKKSETSEPNDRSEAQDGWEYENIDIDMAILKKLKLSISISKENLENIGIDIDREILENIDSDINIDMHIHIWRFW